MPAAEAIYHGAQIRYESGDTHDNVGYWLNPADWVEWQFAVTKPGKYTLTADVASEGAGSFEVMVGPQKLALTAPNTGNYAQYQTVTLGTLDLAAAGKTSLRIKAVAAGWAPFNLKTIKFQPAK